MGIFDKAKDALAGNAEHVGGAIDKAGDLADEKTGGKYAQHVDKGQDIAKDRLAGDKTDEPLPPA